MSSRLFLRTSFSILLLAVIAIMPASFITRKAQATEPASTVATTQVIPLWPEGVPGIHADAKPDNDTPSPDSYGIVYSQEIHTPTLTCYPAPRANANGTAVIICPGGGYARLAMDHEGIQVAHWLNTQGVTAFILKYRLKEYGQPAPLRDVLRAIRIVRTRANDFGVQPDRIGILGFSAGGHLASCAVTLYDNPAGKTGATLDATSARPDFGILLYPVTSMRDPVAHAGSRENLIGKNPAPSLVALYSTDEQITKKTPPTLLIAATDDKAVPVENSIQFYLALKKASIPTEIHLYEKGGHGFGMKKGTGPAEGWTKLAEDWMRLNGWLPKS